MARITTLPQDLPILNAALRDVEALQRRLTQLDAATVGAIGLGATMIPYSPTLSALTGTFTTADVIGKYKQIGNMVFLKLQLTITTVGTGTFPLITLPVLANQDFHQSIGGVPTNGNACTGEIGYAGNFSQVLLRNYDGTSPSAGGIVYYIGGSYEAA